MLERGGSTGRRAVGLVAALLALVVFAGPAHAAFPGKNGKIAFDSDRDGNYEIYAMNPDGGGVTRLTNDPGADCLPTWSADGKRIAFLSDRGTAGSASCSSPDRDGYYDVYLMDQDGTNVVRITNDGGAPKSMPTWSPDGSKIAYIDSVSQSLFAVEVDGTGLTPIFSTGYYMRDPVWSADGNEIAFSYSPMGFGLGHIATVRPDGTGLTDRTARNNAFFPDSSPDGSKYAYDREDFLAVVNHDGTDDHLVPDASAPEYYPAWSPDGSKIVVERHVGAQVDIYTLNPDGTGRTNLTNGAGVNRQPDWQPLLAPQRSDYKNAAQFCKAEREFLGDEAFAGGYGTNRNRANAYGKCVSSS